MGDEHPTTRLAAVSSRLPDEPGGSSGMSRRMLWRLRSPA
jgi:hypothetical protein